ncbi:hypothetical protein NQ317_003923 [Molorchus minor]|uniref:IST1 homolog n=1 Tax=Molorchus minor TaxID=1323400 RepID=A0ABQ9IVY7_9CUCU|nr:hypothetical protein NQ317_003923 [Molorchus minor]
MFSSGPNYSKLKTNLRLAISRLKLLQKKKTELTEKSRKEIADYIAAGKYERAKELKVIGDLLASKYGPSYAEACRLESIETISPKLKHKMSIQSPPKLLVEKYVIEIAKVYNVPYEPDPQIMQMDKGSDSLLIDFSNNSNDLGGGGGMPQPPGFVGYPQPPPLPHLVDPMPLPFAYPPNPSKDAGPSAPPPSFSYNIPPGDEKLSNTDYSDNNLPTYNNLYPDPNLQDSNNESIPQEEDNPEEDKSNKALDDNFRGCVNSDSKPKPAPRNKVNDKGYDLPELPSVPSTIPNSNDDDKNDIDFDDLTRRFNELKKKY